MSADTESKSKVGRVVANAPWPIMTLGDITTKIGSGSTPRGGEAIYQEAGIPLIRSMNVHFSGFKNDGLAYLDEREASKLENVIVHANDVLLNITGASIGRVTTAPESMHGARVNQHVCIIRPQPNLLTKFLSHYFASPDQQARVMNVQVGATRQALTKAMIQNWQVPVPPVATQRRIVAEIEKQFTRLDAGVAALRRVHANLKRYRAAVLKAACEGRLVPTEAELHKSESRSQKSEAKSKASHGVQEVMSSILTSPTTYETGEQLLTRILADRRKNWTGRGKYKEPTPPATANLPALPKSWTWATMPQLGELNRGKSKHRPRDDKQLYGGPYPFIQTGDIRKSGGSIREHTQTYSEFGLQQSRLWPAGTLCITIAANIAETGILTFSSCFPDSVVGFIHDGLRETTRYVEFFIRTAKEELERFAPATAQKNINLEVLQNVAIPLPPLAEQKRIVGEVERRLSMIDEIETIVTANLTRASRLRQSILSDAFSGRLVDQSSSDDVSALPQTQLSTHLEPEVTRVKTTNRTPPKEKSTRQHASLDHLLELLDDWDGAATPDQLLVTLNLVDDVEALFDLLRTGQARGVLRVPIGEGGNVQRIYE